MDTNLLSAYRIARQIIGERDYEVCINGVVRAFFAGGIQYEFFSGPASRDSSGGIDGGCPKSLGTARREGAQRS